MAKRKSRNKNENKNKPICLIDGQSYTREEYIDLHAEAYYRAMKRCDIEKTPVIPEIIPPKSKKDAFLFGLKIIFCPKKINSSNIASGLLSMLVSMVLYIIGHLLRFFGWLSFACGIYAIFHSRNIFYISPFFICWLLLLLIGGVFCASSKEIEKERNQEKLYALSSGIMASIAVIISIAAILWNIFFK